MKRFIILTIALLAFMLTCRYLPFDKELELAAATISKMTLEATIDLPGTGICFDPESERVFFIPDKESYSTGFMVYSNDGGEVEFMYIQRHVTMGSYTLTQPFPINIQGYNPLKPNYFAETLSDNPGYLLFIAYDYPSSPPPSQICRFNVIVSNGSEVVSNLVAEKNLLNELAHAAIINGAFIHPLDNNLYILYTNISGNFVEVTTAIDPTGNIIESTLRSSPLNTIFPMDMYYCFDPLSLTSAVTYITPEGFKNKWWKDMAMNSYPDPHVRFAILHDASILAYSFEESMAYCYDINGGLRVRFPIGGLRYAFENMGNDGKYYCVFTLTTFTLEDHSNCDPTFKFQVYSIPTADLEKLKI